MATKLVVLSTALLLSNPSAAKEQKKPEQSDFSVVKCGANSSFYFQHRTRDCINEKGQPSCDHNGLFLANKRRCYQCCNKVNSTKSGRKITLSIGIQPVVCHSVSDLLVCTHCFV